MVMARSVVPETFEAIRRQLRIAHGAVDRPMAEIMLDRSRILTVIGQLETTAMPEHVRRNFERKAGGLADARDHPLIAMDRKRRLAVGREDVHACRRLASQPA